MHEFHMRFTYEINTVTTVQVDIFDASRFLSTACHGADEGGLTVENDTLQCSRN